MGDETNAAETVPENTQEPGRPTNVVQALARVIAEMPAISKDQRMGEGNQQYNYRSIEAIAGHAAALFGKYGIVPVPHKVKRAVREIQMGSGRTVWTEDYLRVKYRLYGPGHGTRRAALGGATMFAEDFIETGYFHALARDNSDKGTNKCQPPGTMVRVPLPRSGRGNSPAGWQEVPIESIRAGDRVVTWQRNRSGLRSSGRTVTGVAARPYEGRLLTVTAGGRFSRYTPDHHCLVRLPDRLAGGNEIVYMMRRNDQYRIGRCKWRGEGEGLRRSRIGLAWRCAAENADAAWVLSVHPTVAEAAMVEALTAVRYGIPQTSFTGRTDRQRDKRPSAFPLDEFWAKVGPNGAQADACLTHFGRLIGRPLYERRPDRSQIGTLPTLETAAANLLDGMLAGIPSAPVADEKGWQTWPVRWEPMTVTADYYCGTVHSMEVETDHDYVADGIVTGNCMTQAFKQMLIQVTMVADNRDDPDSYSPAGGNQPEQQRPPTVAEWAADPDGGNWGSEEAMRAATKEAYTALRAKVDAGEISREAAAQAWEAYKHPDSANPDAEKLPTRSQHDDWVSRVLAENPPAGPALNPPGEAPAAATGPQPGPDSQPAPEPGSEAPAAENGPETAGQPVGPPVDRGYRGHLDSVLAAENLDGLIAAIADLPITAVVTELQARGVDATGAHDPAALRRTLGSLIVARAKPAGPEASGEPGRTRRGRKPSA